MRDAGHRTPDAGHRTSDNGHRTSDGEKSKNNISTPQGGGHNYVRNQGSYVVPSNGLMKTMQTESISYIFHTIIYLL